MTSCLFFDPADNYIKVNYFPEEPRMDDYKKVSVDGWVMNEPNYPAYSAAWDEYHRAVAAARASAVKVEDQEQAKYLMAKYIICNSNLECRLNQSGFSKWQPEPNVLYPIPGLTFKVEKVQDFKEFCSDEIIEVEEVAILELPSSNNTPDNTVPIEQQESQDTEAKLKEAIEIINAFIHGDNPRNEAIKFVQKCWK